MVNKCVALNCRSNYDKKKSESESKSSYVPVFKFPSDGPRREEWVKFVSREDWVPTKSAVLCLNHFSKCDILKHPTTGVLKLTKYAVPSKQSDGVPKYLNVTRHLPRKDPTAREAGIKARIREEEEKVMNEWLKKNLIGTDFNSFKENVTSRIDYGSWHIEIANNKVVFYECDFEKLPKVVKCIRINETLQLETFVNGVIVPESCKTKIDTWSTLQSILQKHQDENMEQDVRSNGVEEEERYQIFKYKRNIALVKENLNEIVTYLELNADEESEEEIKKIRQMKFISEQFNLMNSTCNSQRRYSIEMTVWSFMIHLHGPTAYDTILETGFIIVPTVRHLRRLSSTFSCSPSSENENKHYLQRRTKTLDERERFVFLQIDEIHTKERFEYKGGEITGCAENALTGSVVNTKSRSTVMPPAVVPAKTVVAFLAASVFGKYKDVVTLYPAKNLSSDDLHEIGKKVVILLQECDLYVLGIVTDNNRVNGCFYILLNPEYASALQTKKFFTYLNNSRFKTFLTFDPVHEIKCVRNNWLNEKDFSKTLLIPDFDDFDGELLHARFNDLRSLYKKTQNVILKNAHKLTYKTLYPSNLERQKVSLACNIFNDQTFVAVKTEFEENNGQGAVTSRGTVHLIEIFTKWWTIMNVRSKMQGPRRRNKLAEAFYSVDDDRLAFLRRFVQWLEKWKERSPHGTLTQETYRALYTTTFVMMDFIEYSLGTLNIPYVLPGKLQTDPTEKRFSCYRQLSGGNYNISVTQIFESEKKIRLKNRLGVRSAKYGQMKFDFNETPELSDENDGAKEQINNLDSFNDILTSNYLDTDIEESSFLYIAGYAAFKTQAKITCEVCLQKIISSESLNDNFFDELNRGGLTTPKHELILIAQHVMGLVTALMSEKYEVEFLKQKSQKALVIALSKMVISENDKNIYKLFTDICVCGEDTTKIFTKILRIFTNIALNNYIKTKNNALFVTSSTGKARKLKTLDRVSAQPKIVMQEKSSTQKPSKN